MTESAGTLSDAGSVVLPNMDYILSCAKLTKKGLQVCRASFVADTAAVTSASAVEVHIVLPRIEDHDIGPHSS